MKIPILSQPLFEEIIPSTNKKILFRPYLVKEEKLLLIAQQSDNEIDTIRAMRQVLNNCVQGEDFQKSKLATFDLEYLFLKLRAKSVNNMVELAYRDNKDGEIYKFKIDLDEIKVQFPDNVESKIKINDEIGMVMRYPSSDITENMTEFENEVDLIMFFIRNCIESIYDKENIYLVDDSPEEEVSEFINSLDIATFDKVREFLEAMPKLYHKLEYTNKNGTDQIIELKSIKDFFILR